MFKCSSFSFRKMGATFGLLAVLLQIIAMPIACAHMAGRALQMKDAHYITICSVMGSHELLVGADGQPIPANNQSNDHCPFCYISALGSLMIIGWILARLGKQTGKKRLPAPVSASVLSLWLRPFSLAPPSPSLHA